MNIFKLFKKQEPKVEVKVTVTPQVQQEPKFELPRTTELEYMLEYARGYKGDYVIRRFHQNEEGVFKFVVKHTNKQEHVDRIKQLDIQQLAKLEELTEEQVIDSFIFNGSVEINGCLKGRSYKHFSEMMDAVFQEAYQINQNQLNHYEVQIKKRLAEAIVATHESLLYSQLRELDFLKP